MHMKISKYHFLQKISEFLKKKKVYSRPGEDNMQS